MLKSRRFVYFQLLLLLLLTVFALRAYAAETKMMPTQISYESAEDEEFSLDSSSSVDVFSYGEKSIGSFSIIGSDIRNTTYQGVDAYIGTGTFTFSYSYAGTHQTKDDEAWNLVSSGKKKVGELELKHKIKKGVAIVQRSENGRTWTDIVEPQTNLFDKFTEEKERLYSVDESELKQGAFYRVIIAYEMTRKIGKTGVVNVPVLSNIKVDQFENRTFVEEYRFYLAYGENPVIVRDLLSRSAVATGTTVSDGFIIDKNGASDSVKVVKDGGTPLRAVDGAAFYEAGRYVIDIESKIGSKYQYTINVSEGTKLQTVTPQVFENKKNDKYTEENPVSGTPGTGIDSYSALMIGQRGNTGFTRGAVQDVVGYGTNSDRVEIFLQLDKAERLNAGGWIIEADDWGEKEKQTIGETYTGVVGTGAIIVQTSSDGVTWTDIERGRYAEGLFTTDVDANYEGRGPIHVYSPSGDDILNGLYLRVLYAYRARNKEEKLDYRYIEKYEFYLCSSNLDSVTFHNLSVSETIENVYGEDGEEAVALHKRMETMLSGAGTVSGFSIDTSLNPAATYEVFRNGARVSGTIKEYTETGRYEIRLRTPVGDTKSVVVFVDRSTDEEALANYFGSSFITGKRIYSEGTYPVYEGGQTSYCINTISNNLLPVGGTIINTTTGTIIDLESSRDGKTGELTEAGDYVAVLSTNRNYDSDKQSGDSRIFTFRFSLIAEGTAPGPQVNQRELYRYAQSQISDAYPIYYGLTYQSAQKGYITLAFSSKEDAIAYQYDYEKGMVEEQPDGSYLYTGSFIVSQKDRYESKWDLADAFDYYAREAVSRAYFDISDEATYLTLTDDVLKNNKNLRTLELERSVVIFADGEKEKLTDLREAMPIISNKPYTTIMPGTGRRAQKGFAGFQFVQDKYQCDSSSVSIKDRNGRIYSIEYLKDVGTQLSAAGCPTGIVTVTEETIYGDQTEYQAVFINEGDITASVEVACYADGSPSERITITKETEDTHLQVEAFSISGVLDDLDPYDLVLVEGPDGSLSYYGADQKIPDVWAKPGEYAVKVVNRLGYTLSFGVSVKESPYITISFDGESSESIASVLVKRGDTDLKLPTPERYGYEFAGFVDADGNVYKDSIATVTFNDSVVLETLWQAKQFTLLFEDSDGRVIFSKKTDFGKEVDLPVPEVDENSVFVGWEQDGTLLVNNKFRLEQENDVVFVASQKVAISEEDNTDTAEKDEPELENAPKQSGKGWGVVILLLLIAGGAAVVLHRQKSASTISEDTEKKLTGRLEFKPLQNNTFDQEEQEGDLNDEGQKDTE